MNFASFPYLVFLFISLVVYFKLDKIYRHYFLLFSSYVFYSFFGFGFAALMLFTSAVTYAFSWWSFKSENHVHRKLFMLAGISIDIAVFILFKYLHVVDVEVMNWPNFSIQNYLVPIGISFYTFKTIGYCIDIYRGKYEPEPSFAHYALSVSFFPQLIAGPLEKSVVIAQQIKLQEPFNPEKCIDGAKLILWGLFKKIVIADGIANIINPMFADIEAYKGMDLVIIFIAFTFQVYADFSGYSDIAIGSARCFNIELPPNFNKPFLAGNFRNFWRRWHISFYQWFKEYVYLYLMRGDRKSSKGITLVKIGLIFILVGLWHGATLNYLFYVLTAFFWVVLDFSTRDLRMNILTKTKIGTDHIVVKALSYSAIILMISSFEIFFKGNNLDYSFYILRSLNFHHFHHLGWYKIALLAGFAVLLEFMQYFQISPTGHCFEKVKFFPARAVMYLFVVFMLILSSARQEQTFQYFQF